MITYEEIKAASDKVRDALEAYKKAGISGSPEDVARCVALVQSASAEYDRLLQGFQSK